MGVVKLSTAGIVNYEKYSNLRAGIPLPPTGSFDLLETQVLDSTTASVTFSSLSTYAADYQHLQIRTVLRDTRSITGNTTYMRFNGDSGSNYNGHGLLGDGSSVSSFVSPISTRMESVMSASANSTSGLFNSSVVDILDPFETTKYTTIKVLTMSMDGPQLRLGSNAWRNTAAVSSITFIGNDGSFIAGSRFSIYGLRKAV